MVIVHAECSGGWAGQERRVLLEALEMRKRGHQVSLVCERSVPLARHAHEACLAVEEIRYRRAFDPVAIAALRRIIMRERPQILNTHSSKDAWVGGLAALGTGVKVVRTRHLSIPVKPNWRNELLYTRLTDCIVATGGALRDQLIRENGFAPDRIVSVPTGVDLDRFDPERVFPAGLRKEYGLPDNAPLVGVVAMIRAMKGHAFLVEAAPRVLVRFPETRFLVVGEAPEGSPIPAQLQSRARELGIEARLVFTGYRDDVPEIMAALDCVVLPSTRDEGVPQSLTQALAMARPVVATDVGATSEAVRHEETGLLVPPGDHDSLAAAVIRVLAEPRQAQTWALAGRRLIGNDYSASRMAERMEQAYSIFDF